MSDPLTHVLSHQSFPILLIALGAVALAFSAQRSEAQDDGPRIFPYPYEVRDLENGLRIIAIKTGYPNIVSLQIPVQVGSRNEVEPGRSGFAHFFEHMMFRGTKQYPADVYNEILKNAGADQNAFTTDDFTNYHTTFSKEDLEKVLEIEADRFQHLDYSIEDFKTEARAVLGEYNKNYADPLEKLFEVQRDAAFKVHTYKHTTMGFIQDIENMPNMFDYSRTFFDRFYRPERTTIILAGDLPANVFDLVTKYWKSWKRGDHEDAIPLEPAPSGAIREHIDWPSETLPWLTIAWRGPATNDRDLDMPALEILGAVAFSESAPLYQKLVVQEQKVDELFAYFPHQVDPSLLTIAARVKDVADVAYVEGEIMKALDNLKAELVDAERLGEIKSHLKYSFAGGLDNSEAIAEAVVEWVSRTRDIESLNRVYRLFDKVTPEDVRGAAKRWFVDAAKVVVTLSHGELPMPASAQKDAFATLIQKNASPLIAVRLLFHSGSAADPEGKEGLAQLTAAMVAEASSTDMDYEDIQKALFPMAASLSAHVDKEMTVFEGGVHLDHFDRFWQITSAQVVTPKWDEADFARVKSDLVNEIRVSLRANNDEELGKEVLHEMLHDGTYRHQTRGHVGAIEMLTIEDCKRFHAEHYSGANLLVGIAGNLDETRLGAVRSRLRSLPEGRRNVLPPFATLVPAERHVQVRIVEKDTRATAISFGFPIEVTRSHPDYAALWLARSYLGEHRSSNGVLFNRLREIRGLNYGDYAYIEWFPNGMFGFHPAPNLCRSQQAFEIWIRPVAPENAHFALRGALFELDKLVRDGIPETGFKSTKNFLLKFVNVLTKSQDAQLGYAMDSKWYGIGEFNAWITKELRALTIDDVNRALKKHLDSKTLSIAIITPNAEALADALASDVPSPIRYDAPKPQAIVDEDAIISTMKLGIPRANIEIIPVAKIFE